VGLKKGKYAYVEIAPGSFVKVRVIRSKADDSPRKYQVVTRVTSRVPAEARIVKLDSIPEPTRKAILEQLAH